MDEIISYKMCAVKVRNAKLRNYLKEAPYTVSMQYMSVLKTKTYLINLNLRKLIFCTSHCFLLL